MIGLIYGKSYIQYNKTTLDLKATNVVRTFIKIALFVIICSSLFFVVLSSRLHVKGVVHILRNHFPELTDGILRQEVAKVGCGRRPQHL